MRLKFKSSLSLTYNHLRFFSQTQSPNPSLVYAKLMGLENEIRSKSETVFNHELSKIHGFHPSAYSFGLRLNPSNQNDIEQQLQVLKHDYQTSIFKKQGRSAINFQRGKFLKPITSPDHKNVLIPANEDDIAKSGLLLGCPIYLSAKDPEGIQAMVSKYCRLFKVDNFNELQSIHKDGVVIYTITHPRLVEEIRTLEYLLKCSSLQPFSPWDFGYHEIYKLFIEPKLFREGCLVPPEDFAINFVTASYSNRIFDLTMGMLTAILIQLNVSPHAYLERCYALSLIANPYNFTTSWNDAEDWRKPVLQFPRSDVVWNLTDIGTRVMPQLDLLLAQFVRQDNHRIKLNQSNRQAMIIIPPIKKSFIDLSDVELGPALLGHDLTDAIDTLCTQELEFVNDFRAYMSGKLTQTEFNHRRIKQNYTYEYDPTQGVAIGEVINLPEEDALDIALQSPCIHSDLIDISQGIELPQNSYWLSNRILTECMRNDNDFMLAEVFFDYDAPDWLMLERDHRKVAEKMFLMSALIREMQHFLKENERTCSLLRLFFAQIFTKKLVTIDDSTVPTFSGFLTTQERPDLDHINPDFYTPEAIDLIKKIDSQLKTMDPSSNHRNQMTQSPSLRSYTVDFLKIVDLSNRGDINDMLRVAGEMMNLSVYDHASLEESLHRVDRLMEYEKKKHFYTDDNLAKLLNSKFKITHAALVYKCLLHKLVLDAAEKVLQQTTVDSLYCGITFSVFSFVACIKLRAANCAFNYYLNEFYEKNPNGEPFNKLKTDPFNFKRKPTAEKENATYSLEYDIREFNGQIPVPIFSIDFGMTLSRR